MARGVREVGMNFGFISGYFVPAAVWLHCTAGHGSTLLVLSTLPRNRQSQILPSSIPTIFYFHHVDSNLFAAIRHLPAKHLPEPGLLLAESVESSLARTEDLPLLSVPLAPNGKVTGVAFWGKTVPTLKHSQAISRPLGRPAPACPSYTGRGPPGPTGGQWPPMASNGPVNSPAAACMLPWYTSAALPAACLRSAFLPCMPLSTT